MLKRLNKDVIMPEIPPGIRRTTKINTKATPTSQYAKLSLSPDAKKPINTAPTIGPINPNLPPTAAQITNSAESMNPTTCGVTIPWCGAKKAPARPAIAPLIANAAAFTKLVLIPKNCVRSSFSRTASNNCPKGVRIK